MRHYVALLGLVVVLAMGSGCATSSQFTKLPTPAEFKKPVPQLMQEYPDLAKYGSPNMSHLPYAGPLNDAWGEPTSTDCWFLGIFNPFLHQKYRRWEFEGKIITAYIVRLPFSGFKPYVRGLMVEEKK